MPYNGIPPDKTATMEKCVNDVMGRGESKDSAIAICYTSIMGDKKKPTSVKVMAGKKGDKPMINLNFYGDYWKGKLDSTEDITVKAEEIPNVEKSKEEGGETITMKTKEEIKKVSADAKAIADEGKAVEPEVKTEKADPDKGEEKDEMAACMKGAIADGKSEADAKKYCKAQLAAEDKDEKEPEEKADKSTDAKAEADKAEKPAEVEQVQDVNALLKGLIEKIDKLVQKQDTTVEEKPVETPESAPAEGAAPKEEAPVGGESVTPKEDAPVEGASTEGAEVQKAVGDLTSKVDGVLLKITEKIDSFQKSFDKEMEEIKKRVNTLEEQPAPSKVTATHIVSKSDGSENLLSGTEQERLNIILKELNELDAMKKDDIDKYQMGRYWEKAIRLVDEKNGLLVKKATGQTVVQI